MSVAAIAAAAVNAAFRRIGWPDMRRVGHLRIVDPRFVLSDDGTGELRAAIANTDTMPDRLVAVQAYDADRVTMIEQSDVPGGACATVDGIDVAPHAKVAIGPVERFRIRLVGLTRATENGKPVRLILDFAVAGRAEIQVPLSVR